MVTTIQIVDATQRLGYQMYVVMMQAQFPYIFINNYSVYSSGSNSNDHESRFAHTLVRYTALQTLLRLANNPNTSHNAVIRAHAMDVLIHTHYQSAAAKVPSLHR
jgi:hypothetical protein